VIVDKGFAGGLPARAEDKAYWEAKDARRRELREKRGPMDKVMIRADVGWTHDTVTGVPPAFNTDARAKWAKRREEAEIERLFK